MSLAALVGEVCEQRWIRSDKYPTVLSYPALNVYTTTSSNTMIMLLFYDALLLCGILLFYNVLLSDNIFNHMVFFDPTISSEPPNCPRLAEPRGQRFQHYVACNSSR